MITKYELDKVKAYFYKNVETTASTAFVADWDNIPKEEKERWAKLYREWRDIEDKAKEIYDEFQYHEGVSGPKPEWQDGGNADMQEKARFLARKELRKKEFAVPQLTEKEPTPQEQYEMMENYELSKENERLRAELDALTRDKCENMVEAPSFPENKPIVITIKSKITIHIP